MAKTFPLLDQTYSKQKISIFQHFLTTMFCKKKLPRMLVPQNVEKGLPCAFFQVAELLCLLYVPPLPTVVVVFRKTCRFEFVIAILLFLTRPLFRSSPLTMSRHCNSTRIRPEFPRIRNSTTTAQNRGYVAK